MGARCLNELRIIVQRNQRYRGFLQLSDHRPANANGQQQFDSRRLSAGSSVSIQIVYNGKLLAALS
jgi:hypothetical protein